MTIQMTLRLMRAALVVKVQGRTAVWPRATWILPGLSETSREAATHADFVVVRKRSGTVHSKTREFRGWR